MATIVQPYDPWREKLAASILGPLVGNMIQKGQEAEQNRKRNAMLAAWTDANAVQDPLTGGAISTVPDPLAKQDFTTSFERDLRPWANSLVDNGGLPQMDMSMAAPVQPQAPTLTSLFQLGGTKRFGGVNMDTVMPFAKELMAEQEAQRQRALATQRQADISSFADKLSGIEGWEQRLPLIAEGVMRGYYDHDLFKDAAGYVSDGRLTPYQAGQLEIEKYRAASQNAHYERSDALGRDTLAETITDNEFNRRMKQWELENPEMQITVSDMGDHKEVIGVNKRTGEPKLLWTGKVGMSPKDAAAAENKGAVTEQDIFAMKGKQIDAQLKSLDAREAAVRRGQVDIHGELTEAGKEELKQIAAEREIALQKQDNLYHQRSGVLFPGDVPPDVTSQDVADEILTGLPNGVVSGDVSVPVSTGSGPVDPAAGKKYAWINRQGEGVTQQQYEKMLAATLTGSPEIRKLGINTVDDLHRVLAERGFYMQ